MDIIERRYMLVTSGSERVITQGADKKNLSNNQELSSQVISSFILLTLMFFSGVVW